MITNPEIAYGIACIFLFAYLVLSSIEFGAAFLLLLPESILERQTIRTYVNPIWETTNIFLVFFVMSIFTCFPKAVPGLSLLMFPIVEIALVFFVLRILGILGLFYGDKGHWSWRALFFVGSWGAAITLSGFYHVVITGTRMPWPLDLMSVSLVLLVITTILMLSSAFFLMFTEHGTFHPRLAHMAYLSLIMWYAAAVLFLNDPLRLAGSMLAHQAVASDMFVLITVIGAALTMLIYARHYNAAFIAACFALGVLFFGSAYAHLPYIVYPWIMINASFTGPQIFHAILFSGIVGAVILIPALFLLYDLFGSEGKSSASAIE